MIELIILVVVAVVAYNLGITVTAWRLRELLHKEAKAQGLLTDEEQEIGDKKNTLFKLWVEQSSDMLYLYNYENDTFVCQAKSLDELAKLALEYKNIKHAAVVVDNKAYLFIDGRVETSS